MPSPNDNIGRIHKKPLVVCNLSLFTLCLLSVIARFYVRLRIQKEFSIDDGFLLFGTGCLIAAIALLFCYVDLMYMAEALVSGLPNVDVTPNFIRDSLWFHKMIIISLVLTWWSLMSVKLCFLFLFKKLVQYIRALQIYWWIVMIFNIAVALYGSASYFAACPHLSTLACGQGAITKVTIKFSISQMVLDIVGDLMILFIPCRLIWKVKIKMAQKFALASCLCLTALIIVCTIMRISSLSYYNTIDASWETFWQYVSASVGLTMTSVAAFRSQFISHHVSHRQQDTSDFEKLFRLYADIRHALRKTFSIQLWKSRAWYSQGNHLSQDSDSDQGIDLGKIERGTITGLRTFIRQYQRNPYTASQIMGSQTDGEIDEIQSIWSSPDRVVVVKGSAGNRRHDPISGDGGSGSGRHEKILVNKESRRHDKMAVHKFSWKDNKMLHSQESRKHDKMLIRQGSSEEDKILAIGDSDKYETMLVPPEQVLKGPGHHGGLPLTATSGPSIDGLNSWPRGGTSGEMTPKTKIGIMSKMKCGGFVFSAGIKAERYREKESQ